MRCCCPGRSLAHLLAQLLPAPPPWGRGHCARAFPRAPEAQPGPPPPGRLPPFRLRLHSDRAAIKPHKRLCKVNRSLLAVPRRVLCVLLSEFVLFKSQFI